MNMSRLICACLMAGLLTLPAKAAGPVAFAPAITLALDTVIVPNHEAFMAAAAGLEAPAKALCAAPSAQTLSDARVAFQDAVIAWSRIEMFRFGPARDENRFEKLFYWPDRKGRGLKQVQTILADENPTATAPESLAGKSVAMQGLPALEFVLFGTGAETLVSGNEFRCTYATALAMVIANNAAALFKGWSDPGGYADLMRQAGKNGSPYQSHGEVVQDLLRAASEQLQIIRDIKIGASIRDTPEKARPKRAPFWRSDLTLRSMEANLDGVFALFDGALDTAVPDAQKRYVSALSFELEQIRGTLKTLKDPWLETATGVEGHQKLAYAQIPLAGAVRVVATSYPEALGLVLGFNSLDGD